MREYCPECGEKRFRMEDFGTAHLLSRFVHDSPLFGDADGVMQWHDHAAGADPDLSGGFGEILASLDPQLAGEAGYWTMTFDGVAAQIITDANALFGKCASVPPDRR